MTEYVKTFVENCLDCLVSRSGEMIPRPVASSLHVSIPNEVLDMDYLYMGQSSRKDFKYVLIMKDDSSSFVWLWRTAQATGEAAGDAITTWIGTFGSVKWLFTDQRTHFTNNLMKELTDQLKVSHHFMTA